MMEIPRYSPREPGGGAAIHPIYHSSSLQYGPPSHRASPLSTRPPSPTLASSVPMSIPTSYRPTADATAPPPLPPPRHFPPMQPNPDARPEPSSSYSYNRRTDEGYHSLSSYGSQDSCPKFMSHDHAFRQSSVNKDYDNSLLKKLDPKRTLDRHSPPRSALSIHPDSLDMRQKNTQLPHLSLPIRNTNHSGLFLDSPVQSTSPRISLLGSASTEHRSPVDTVDMDRSPFMRYRRANSGSLTDDTTVSRHSSIDHGRDDAEFPVDASSLTRLRIDDALLRNEGHAGHAGQKRRASSPPSEDVPSQGLPGSSELVRRREGASRASPTPRLTILSQGSMHPASSGSRSGHYVPAPAVTTSNMASMGSYGRISPNGHSPVEICNSPFNAPVSHTHSPRMPIARPPHSRNGSNEQRQPLASPRKVSDVPKSGTSKLQGGYFMCECCPKKPKKFETHEELQVHEAEKQYECSFCGSRFKNKNEAERHQNSLHVRRHSWSCSALLKLGPDRAFHDSATRPGEADACGYCGEEFPRTGGTGRMRQPTERDWEDRVRHLQDVHKFRECNASKKFFRADHFRQHLKHSHGGTSGKWTNMLETACMLDEQ